MIFDWHWSFPLGLLLLVSTAGAAEKPTRQASTDAPVTLVVFGDLQCPDCAAAEPLLQEASAQYAVPLERRDFPLPKHAWAFAAHVLARYFDSVAPTAGEQFRRWLMQNQSSINQDNLFGMASRFAAQHKIALPENYDPRGEFKKQVEADVALGRAWGVVHTPTVFVVTANGAGAPLIETIERPALFAQIEQARQASHH